MSKKIAFLILMILSASPAWAKSLQMVTYYPAPTAAYDRLRLVPSSSLGALGSACDEVGTMYINADDTNKLYICNSAGGGSGQWGFLKGVWVQSGHNIMLSDTDFPVDKKVGIGTGSDAPEFKLTLDNDGGIMATGAVGSGAALTTAGAGTRLIWYPAKAALRAGQVSNTQWNDTNIGNDSVAFGYNSFAPATKSTILGGEGNQATLTGTGGTVHGGLNNSVSGSYGTVVGGESNTANAEYGFVGGGRSNDAGDSAAILGGDNSTALSGGAIVGGEGHIGGYNATIVGGRNNRASPSGVLPSENSMVVGGSGNVAQGLFDMIVGGRTNLVNARYSAVVGGWNNQLTDASWHITILGGKDNRLINSSRGVIGGGEANRGSYSSVIVGGRNNITPGGYGFIGGGDNNRAQGESGVLGGSNNMSMGTQTFVGGGNSNIINGGIDRYATILGGSENQADGDSSLAGGRNMKLSASADRTFVWGYSAVPVTINTAGAFLIYSGNVGVNTITPTERLHINGNMLVSTGNVILNNPPAIAAPVGNPKIDPGGVVGLDMAESFLVNEDVSVGDILVMDPAEPGRLRKSRAAYDATVVGVVSGAPALLLKGEEFIASPAPVTEFKKDTEASVALAGRVLCKVSLENGPIQTGDLLTTSSETGYAMKAADKDRAFGAVIGRALEPFAGDESPTGMIKVFIKQY